MPKVSQEYFANKKKLITDAAYALCLEKTVSTVTMQDIINRTGLCQGGIYRFYRDIDEILADMLTDLRSRIKLREQADEIFAAADRLHPSDVTFRIFDLLGDYMTHELSGAIKIDFELSVLAMNAPARIEKILARAGGAGEKEYIMQRATGYFGRYLAEHNTKVKIQPEELAAYITSAYSGIQMCCIVNNCYRHSGGTAAYQPKVLLRTLAESVNRILELD